MLGCGDSLSDYPFFTPATFVTGIFGTPSPAVGRLSQRTAKGKGGHDRCTFCKCRSGANESSWCIIRVTLEGTLLKQYGLLSLKCVDFHNP